MKFWMAFTLTALLLSGFSASAEMKSLTFKTPEAEADYHQLTEELRCLVCQNQTLADSHAELALDLKQQTYDMISEGKSPTEIKAYMVQRYGDFVLYKPPFQLNTLLLWLGPFLILALGLTTLLRFVRRQKEEAKNNKASQTASQTEELQHAHDLLTDKDKHS
ncbi:MAG: cytochrome c-type biogenesis protein CcmH [Gammaproteobacteria bacterium]|nr:cytochrome c-type biogenesis protein CcmH [Gammaproteobacteria bacterium]